MAVIQIDRAHRAKNAFIPCGFGAGRGTRLDFLGTKISTCLPFPFEAISGLFFRNVTFCDDHVVSSKFISNTGRGSVHMALIL